MVPSADVHQSSDQTAMMDVRDANEQRAADRARSEWARLRGRLQTVTPRTVGRTGLVILVGVAAIAVVVASWPTLVPFAIGGLIAYLLMPVVDALDRVMPRVLAAFLAMAAALGALLAAIVLVVPPLASGFLRLALELPTEDEIAAASAAVQASVGGLPEGSREIVVPVLGAVATAVRDLLAGMSTGLDDAVPGIAATMLQAVSAFLGLIVLPTWVLAAMAEKHRARRAIDARLAPWLRRDAWAVFAIADRAAGAYLRGYVFAAALVGVFVYIGVMLAPRLGGPTFPQALPLAVFAGIAQVVPIVGPLLGFLPGLLVAAIDPERAGAYVVIYLVAQIVGTRLVRARLIERRLGVHPLLLVPGVLVVGQMGLLWLLLSAPIVCFAVDLVRYLHGRLSEPPQPAGVLPRTAAWERAPGTRIPWRAGRRRPTAPAVLTLASGATRRLSEWPMARDDSGTSRRTPAPEGPP